MIEAQPDILSADLQGSREELLEAVIDPKELETYGLSSEQIINSIARNNRLIPAGSLDNGEGRFAVKVPSVIEEYSDVFDIPVKSDGDTVITLSDVATVRRTFKDRTQYSRVDGQNTIALNVVKRANSNVIEAIANTKKVTEEFRKGLPARVNIFYSQDQAPYAESQVVELEGNILDGTVFGHGHRGRCHGDSQRPHCWLWYPCVVFVLADFYLPAWLLVQLHGDVRHVVRAGYAHRRRHCGDRVR